MKTFLKRIQIEGFKSIRSSTIQLRPLNVLIGANGAGKSNFISFFKFLNQITSGDLGYWINTFAGGANSILHLGGKVTSKVKSSLHFQGNGNLFTYNFLLSHAPATDGFVFSEEQIIYRADTTKVEQKIPFKAGDSESKLRIIAFSKNEAGIKAREVRDFLAGIRPYQFQDTSENARVKQTTSVDDNLFLKSDAGNLASVLLLIKTQYPMHYQRIITTIRLSAPFFRDFVLEPNGQNIRLRYSEFGSDTTYGAHQISDGTLRFMALMTLLLQPLERMPSVIIIDEPELGLHPHALETLLSVMRSVSENRQIIVSTQSVALVDRLEPEEVIVAERQGSETVFKRLESEQLESWLEDYSLGELWEKNVFGGRPS